MYTELLLILHKGQWYTCLWTILLISLTEHWGKLSHVLIYISELNCRWNGVRGLNYSLTNIFKCTPALLHLFFSFSWKQRDCTNSLFDNGFPPMFTDYGKPKLRKYSQRNSLASNKHVHFKPLLMTDKEHIAYFGPLMKLDEVGITFKLIGTVMYEAAYMTVCIYLPGNQF